MAHPVAIESMTLEEQLARLRQHWAPYLGYAFALAHRAGLGPEEAARLWMKPLLSGRPTRSPRSADELESWIRENASALEVFHGNVHVERDGHVFTMKVSLSDDTPSLELWGASLEYFVRWGVEQVRMLGEVQGFQARGWLEGETMWLEFAPA